MHSWDICTTLAILYAALLGFSGACIGLFITFAFFFIVSNRREDGAQIIYVPPYS
jgi:hypothetical protein